MAVEARFERGHGSGLVDFGEQYTSNPMFAGGFHWSFKEYNNTLTGEIFGNLFYPEFEGHHANLYWASFEPETTPFTIYSVL